MLFFTYQNFAGCFYFLHVAIASSDMLAVFFSAYYILRYKSCLVFVLVIPSDILIVAFFGYYILGHAGCLIFVLIASFDMLIVLFLNLLHPLTCWLSYFVLIASSDMLVVLFFLLIASSDILVVLFLFIASSDIMVISVTVLAIGSVLFLLLFDVVCHVTKNRGVINRLIRHRNRRRKYGKCKWAVFDKAGFFGCWRTKTFIWWLYCNQHQRDHIKRVMQWTHQLEAKTCSRRTALSAGTNRKKIFNQCHARENIQFVPCTGKYTTGAKCRKTCN